MKNTQHLPYEISQESGGRAFLMIELPAGRSAWPWHALRAMHLAPDETTLTLEYAEHSVVVRGVGLGLLLDLAASARLKSLRLGESSDLRITGILPVGVSSE